MRDATRASLVAAAIGGCLLGLAADAGATLSKCKAKINGSDGTVLVSAWTSTAGIGMAGLTGSTNGGWTNTGGAACNTNIALFCIEQ